MVVMATFYMILEMGGGGGGGVGLQIQSYLRFYLSYSIKIGFKIKAKTHVFLPVVRLVNHLICIFMDINENYKNEVKS